VDDEDETITDLGGTVLEEGGESFLGGMGEIEGFPTANTFCGRIGIEKAETGGCERRFSHSTLVFTYTLYV
jgi:hypothetical protein